MADKLFQPKDLAKRCNIKRNTLKRYLSYRNLFPPVKVDENTGYRYYNEDTVLRLELFKVLRKRPFSYKEHEVEKAWDGLDIRTMMQQLDVTKNSLYNYLRGNNRL